MGAYRWVVVAAFGCGAPAKPQASASPNTSCRVMADALFALDDWNHVDPVAAEKMRAITETRCRDDRWSDASQECFRTLRQRQDYVPCNNLLTASQKTAVEAHMARAFTPTEPAPDDSVATTLCPTGTAFVVKTWRLGTSGPDLCRASRQALAKSSAASTGGYELRVLETGLAATETAVTCKIFISVRLHSNVVGTVSGGARVDATGPSAERDCVDAVVEDLITVKIGPFVQQHAAKKP